MSRYWPCTCNEIFDRHWRVQIRTLLLHPDNHPAALLCMFACMDLAFACKKGFRLAGKKLGGQYNVECLVKYYFPPCLFPDSKNLAQRLINGLKHAAFVRPGIGLRDSWDGEDRILEPIRRDGENIVIAPTAFWHHVEAQIDEIFSERVYPFPQEINCEERKSN